MKLLVLLLAFLPSPLAAQEYLQPQAPLLDPLKEYRQCGVPPRTSTGIIKRSSTVLAHYKKYHPCPVTGLSTGSCLGWQINHVIPLASGGCDAVSNLMWLPIQIKTCTALWCIDRWERKYYAVPHGKLPEW